MSSQTPPIEWNDLPPPPDLDFSMPDDPFPVGFFDDTFSYQTDDDPFVPFTPPDMDAAAPTAFAPTYATDDGWSWHDATIVAVGCVLEDGEQEQYSIGAVDLYANVHTGDLGGSYIEIETFDDIDQAAAYYHELQDDIHERGLLPFQLVDYAGGRAAERAAGRGEPAPVWRGATDVEYAAYDEMRSLDAPGAPDLPPDDLDLDAIFAGDVPDLNALFGDADTSTPSADEAATFKALREIGIAAENFNPDADPPPFVDPDTGMAYWIGVFQPDKDDPENCVTSILSLGRDPDTGEMAAQLAPCVPGDWDKSYEAAEYLLGVVEKGGIERAFETAEGMALA
ncbi:MAG: hypothetical protein SF162_01005, partial [bacterium]|nr:hypothetical protein [bacterium]